MFFKDTDILYKDEFILVINKPSGIPVHKGRGGGENLEQYFHELKFGYENPPYLAHRLDFGTSGCLVLARNKLAASRLGKIFIQNRVIKTYLSVVHGKMPESRGRISFNLKKKVDVKYLWHMEVAKEGGQEAVTDYEVISEVSPQYSLVKLMPITGRTHQLRVHLSAVSCPILGDKVYGLKDDGFEQLHLHAASISLPYYHNQPKVDVMAPLPGYWQERVL